VTRRIDPDSHTACTVNCLPAPITAPVCLFVCLFVVWCGVLHTTPNTPHLDTRSHYPLPSSARLPHCSAKPLAFGPLPPPLLQATPTTTKNQQPRERLRARRSGQISEVAARCFFVCLCCCVVFVNTFFLVCVSRFRPSWCGELRGSPTDLLEFVCVKVLFLFVCVKLVGRVFLVFGLC